MREAIGSRKVTFKCRIQIPEGIIFTHTDSLYKLTLTFTFTLQMIFCNNKITFAVGATGAWYSLSSRSPF